METHEREKTSIGHCFQRIYLFTFMRWRLFLDYCRYCTFASHLLRWTLALLDLYPLEWSRWSECSEWSKCSGVWFQQRIGIRCVAGLIEPPIGVNLHSFQPIVSTTSLQRSSRLIHTDERSNQMTIWCFLSFMDSIMNSDNCWMLIGNQMARSLTMGCLVLIVNGLSYWTIHRTMRNKKRRNMLKRSWRK